MTDKMFYIRSGARIKERREALGLTLEEVGKGLGVNKSTIKRYEDGVTKRITIATYEKLAEILDTTPLYLMGEIDNPEGNENKNKDNYALSGIWETENLLSMHPVPILGEIKAGTPRYAEQDILGYTYINRSDVENYFALRVVGDSMDLVNIKEGSVVVVLKQNYIENGDIGVVLIDNESATVKRVYLNGNTATLMPQSSNPNNQPIMVDLKKQNFEILGKVIKVEYYL